MSDLGVLAVLLLVSLWMAKGARRIRMPQVVGFVVAGVCLRQVGWVDEAGVLRLELASRVALGIIGFTIGSELRWATLRQLGRTIAAIVPLEAVGAFVLVGAGAFLVTRDGALALLLGAMASATAPAGTVDVLREYKARGPMTTVLYAVVGLDDAAALVIFGFAMPVARVLLAPEAGVSWGHAAAEPFVEIGLSIALGAAVGGALALAGRWAASRGESLVLVLAALLVTAAVAEWGHLSPILAAMTVGVLTANVIPTEQARVRHALEDWAQPLYLVFFALVGARLQLRLSLLAEVGLLAGVYVVLRTVGKAAGTYLGARIGRATGAVRKYTGLGLLSQAGVAIGLAILSYHELEGLGPKAAAVGHTIISTITLTTLVVQLIGPPMLRLALKKAGESPVLAAAPAGKGAA